LLDFAAHLCGDGPAVDDVCAHDLLPEMARCLYFRMLRARRSMSPN
jgi:hypothetical protein